MSTPLNDFPQPAAVGRGHVPGRPKDMPTPNAARRLALFWRVDMPPAPSPKGDSHAIWVTAPNDYIGVADHRFAGKAAGY